MNGLSDKDWEDFLHEEESDNNAGNAGEQSPFAVPDSEEPIDPLVFVESKEAPELRYVPPTPKYTLSTDKDKTSPAPYFVGASASDKEWVPAGQAVDNEKEELVTATSGVLGAVIRLLLFMVPVGIIGVTFGIALSLE
jgi:hypothetical protein